ncbi:molybdopterin synthase sulfur carrier subunit [Biomphalaria pfeifferi]|uniref:Molybdopterin synthase sulfur carrier subunit n=1 Tax=Biomphalaria pfeifferi TaxID=112525 RepID=A0AAD8BSV8_BIOPF|nr:molybdopterin synthase sulfur carrier subunit [Biomphalaria pfeifferi]
MAYGSERVTCLVSLLFFAKSRELVGQKEVQLQVPSACTGKQLLNHIVLFYPELSLISNNLVLSLNDKYLDIDENQVTLQENDELAVIPPISGG